MLIVGAPACLAQSKAGLAPVAKVNDTVLTQFDLDRTLNEILPAMTFHGGITPEKREEYRGEAMERLIKKELFYQEALRLDIKADKEWDEFLKKAMAEVGGKKNYNEILKKAGLTDKEYEGMVRKDLLVEKLRKVEIEDKSVATDREARDYFETNKDGFKRPEAWRVRHILVSVAPDSTSEEWESGRERAEEALKKIKDGEDMASVAWDYSDDPYRVKGGDLGIVHSGQMTGGLESVMRRLEAGEVSDVIQTIYGYHIVRVEDKLKPEQLQYEEVEMKIKTKIARKKRDELEENLLERLRATARIEVY